MGTWLTVFGTLVLAAAAKFIADDFRELLIWGRKRLIEAALQKLPQESRARFSEEWASDLADKPGEAARFIWAFGCYRSAPKLGHLLREGEARTLTINKLRQTIQRAFDISLAVLLASGLWPLITVLSLAAALSTGRPLTASERVGKDGNSFRLYRFRTAVKTETDAITLTKVGRLLHRLQLTDVAIILNIAKGEMAFVGPKPRSIVEFSMLRDDYQKIYKNTKPGLISPSMLLNDPYEEAAVDYEFEYFRTRNFIADIKVILDTIPWAFVGHRHDRPFHRHLAIVEVGVVADLRRWRMFSANDNAPEGDPQLE